MKYNNFSTEIEVHSPKEPRKKCTVNTTTENRQGLRRYTLV